MIPGVLGSELVNYETGEVVWPSAFRSSQDGLSLPVSPDLEHNYDNLVARKIINTARLAKLAPEVYVYHDLLDALKKYGGYREGDWNNPGADGDQDTFYVFPYDWRRDNVETARDFIGRLETLKRKLNRPDLRFNVVAHSMGGLVARYAAMYGDADLAPEGVAPRPNWAGAADINKIIMFGTPNEGSADAFATLLEGYSVTEGLRPRLPLLNKLSREDIFTAPSSFQLLPDRAATRFLDEELRPIEVDLYDPAVWRRYGWSPVADSEYRQRFVKGRTRGDDAPFSGGSLDELDAYFSIVLSRAKRFHEALDVETKDSPVPLFAFGGDCEETLVAPVILFDKKEQRWVTLIRPREIRTSTGRRFSEKEVTEAMYGPGDGRVTRRSLLGEDLTGNHLKGSIFGTVLPIVYSVFACDLHGELQNNKTLQDNALTTLVNEAMR
ncbi:MAG TPA: hypothetical protein VEV81_09030 [Pyrinomonadaceae bacterium]|nr:hypothetical protein [Pyrinomonadaceae bacterium]